MKVINQVLDLMTSVVPIMFLKQIVNKIVTKIVAIDGTQIKKKENF